MSIKTRLLTLVVLAAAAACGPDEPPQGTKVVFEEAGAELTFTAPPGWESQQPASQFRKHQFRLPGADGGDAEVAVFSFPGGGGSTQANIDRWTGQFSAEDGSPAAADVNRRSVGDFEVTVIDIAGTYTPTMRPGGGVAQGPEPNRRMLAAVIETDADPWFVRLLGPQETVRRWEASFFEYLESARK